MLQSEMKRSLPWFAILVVLLGTALVLRGQGRLWWCSCDYLLVWSGDPWSSDNSQHLLDPYSFTHLLHGFLLCGLLALLVPRLSTVWQLWLAVTIEAAWEVVENSEFVIRRYREETAALGYHGDTIVNSLGDILVCGLDFMVAQRLGFKRAFVVFLVTEVTLAILIRDNLTLNIVMLIHPLETIKEWQAAGH
jgi:Protein of unknown function (DUF2585)